MRVLVTRAPEGAARTAAALAAHGHEALLSPVLEIVATQARWPAGVIDALIATSAQAFDQLTVEAEWPTPEARRLMPLFLVGARTGEATRAKGFAGPARIAADTTAFAASIAELPAARLLYLAGRERKPDVEQALGAAGRGFAVMEVYEARAVERLGHETLAALATGTVGAVLHYSRRSASIFLDLAEQAGIDTVAVPQICISADAAAPLLAAGQPLVLVAEHPDEATMLALVAALEASGRTI